MRGTGIATGIVVALGIIKIFDIDKKLNEMQKTMDNNNKTTTKLESKKGSTALVKVH